MTSELAPSPEADLPADWWQQQSVAAGLSHWFKNHIVTLHLPFKRGDELHQELYSGFTLLFRDRLFWITAAHCVRALSDLLHDSSVTIRGAAFLDGYHVAGASSIPVDPRGLQWAQLAIKGSDIGIVPLRYYYAKQLAANPAMRPLTDKMWTGIDDTIHSLYLVGAPACWTSRSVEQLSPGVTNFALSTPIVAIPCKRTPDRGQQHAFDTFWGHESNLYADVLPVTNHDGKPLEGIHGTSGGPILSIQRVDGGLLYHFVGVQSGVLPQSNILRATRAEVLRSALELAFDTAEAE